jgi:molybdopterin converting factor small subunit
VSEVVVRLYAAARTAAGIATVTVPADDLATLVESLGKHYGARLAAVLSASSFLVDGIACHDRTAPLPDGATVDILPPFAGG